MIVLMSPAQTAGDVTGNQVHARQRPRSPPKRSTRPAANCGPTAPAWSRRTGERGLAERPHAEAFRDDLISGRRQKTPANARQGEKKPAHRYAGSSLRRNGHRRPLKRLYCGGRRPPSTVATLTRPRTARPLQHGQRRPPIEHPRLKYAAPQAPTAHPPTDPRHTPTRAECTAAPFRPSGARCGS